MSGETNLSIGDKNYLNMWAESAWGTKPGSPVVVPIPYDNCDIQQQTILRNPRPTAGLIQPKGQRKSRGHVQGPLVMPLYAYHVASISASVAEYMLGWCLADQESSFLSSRGIEHALGPNLGNMQYNGLRINSWTLTGSDDQGNYLLALDLMGKSQASVTTAISQVYNHYDYADFEFADSVLSIDSTEIEFKSIQIQGQNALSPTFLNSRSPTLMHRSQNVRNMQIVFPRSSNVYDLINSDFSDETDYDVSLEIRGLHRGSGASGDWTVCTIDIPQARFAKNTRQAANGQVMMQLQDLTPMKPDSSSNAMTVTWTLE